MDTWQMIKAERASLVDALDKLSDTDWDQPSLCVNWTVREVVAHLVATANMTPPKFFAKLVGNGFSFQSMVRKDIAQVTAGRTNAELVGLLRSRVDARTAPPGPTLSWLGETIVHGEDIFRAVGVPHQHPVERVVVVADFYKSSNLLIGAKSRISGITLRATDTDWQHGSGPEVSGPVIALLMAMTGRKAALDDLTGDGVAVLRERD
ncbi:maleylpyruvate isomerase family mycothiol-dependent enzyme [Micromonospora sp. CB01531]|uniref:maleylpyruvate isomerase family mycothiol-dependent enzyme n=1 Tax=Micromonospora sp. CB01531 TaxID=1718947 RepID=UPI000939F739|nr:maleylpyruvate isomerase family mycothiol-dependent enzyme [Micromonospora sp. CB01531]OKI49620.1 hypothetical protein A6A27_09280 [Micromonospora sp. CB01531]